MPKILEAIYRLLLAPLFIPIVLIIRLISPFLLVRVGPIRSDRIGAFASDSHEQFIDDRLSPKNIVNFYWIEKKEISNYFMYKLIIRNFPNKIHWWVKYIYHWNRYIPGGYKHNRPSTKFFSRDVERRADSSGFKFEFTESENLMGFQFLKKIGWTEGENFVCVQIRDSEYMTKRFGDDDGSIYRNSNIETFTQAFEWLNSKGVWVIRMGRLVKNSVSINNKLFFDYALSTEKSDFLDVWLFANCSACITTSSGPCAISDIFRRPIIAVNFLPLQVVRSWSYAIHTPKRLFWKNTGFELTIKEYLDADYHLDIDYIRNGINIKDLTNIEILNAIQDAWFSISKNQSNDIFNEKEKKRSHQILKNHDKFYLYHKEIHPMFDFGRSWFKSVN